ncbi:unnamed protein product, partial [Meganyctiphanes norvegica]
KVTVHRTSYTVIVTYFFWKGSIHVLLNKLVKLTTKDYDSQGTASMVIDCLVETLGLSKTHLANKLLHFVYDGVYCSKAQRVRGGGSLSLSNNVSLQLGLSEYDITGEWDASHNMQLVFSDTMNENPIILNAMNILFEAMSEFNTGKSSTHFEERARELEHLVLMNKRYQATRFVRTFVRGATAGLRNLPTLYHLIAEEYEASVESCNNTKAKKLNSTLENLRSSENIAIIIGIVQILEIYTKASLAAQHSLWFPTQVWAEINKAKEKIKDLSQTWVWEEKTLKISGIGSPKKHIENLKKGKYSPSVPLNSIRKSAFNEKLSSLGQDSVENLFEDEAQLILEFAGEIGIEGEFELLESKVISSLQSICSSLTENWNQRQTESKIQQITINTFSVPIKHDNSIAVAVLMNKMKNKLESVIDCLPRYQGEKFDCESMVPGFMAWNAYFIQKHSDPTPIPINTLWKRWISQLGFFESEKYLSFINLFQNLQIRTMSEAICESIGSMMVSHSGKGRHLQPVFFSQELFLRFNLGPLHLLNDLINEVWDDIQKEYIRKCDKSKRFDKLVSRSSAAIEHFRQRQGEIAKMPLDLWKNKKKRY